MVIPVYQMGAVTGDKTQKWASTGFLFCLLFGPEDGSKMSDCQ
jgi:hypothetical protein